MMRQSFVWKPDFPEVILFSGAEVKSGIELMITCFVFALLGVVYETLRCIRTIIVSTSRKDGLQVTMGSKQHFLETFIFLAELLFSYCLMLVVMSFNLWLGIAIVTGSAVGYLLCGTITNRFKIRMELKAAKNGALLKGESEGHRRHLVLLKGESEGHRRHLAEAANKTLNDSDLGNGQEIQKSDTHEREEMSSLLKKDSRGHRRHLEEEEAKDAHQRADRKGILKKRESKGMEMISLK